MLKKSTEDVRDARGPQCRNLQAEELAGVEDLLVLHHYFHSTLLVIFLRHTTFIFACSSWWFVDYSLDFLGSLVLRRRMHGFVVVVGIRVFVRMSTEFDLPFSPSDVKLMHEK